MMLLSISLMFLSISMMLLSISIVFLHVSVFLFSISSKFKFPDVRKKGSLLYFIKI